MKTTKPLIGILAITTLLSLHLGAQPFSTNLFVSTNGSDALGNGSSNAPYATIQKAVDMAPNSGALICIYPGAYSGPGNHNINLEGKGLVIQSFAGPRATIMNCQSNQAFLAHSSETTNTVIDGLTITNGFVSSGADWGGAGLIDIGSPAQPGLTIRNCVIALNQAVATYVTTSLGMVWNGGQGTNVSVVENCLFYGNSVGGGGWTSVGGGGAAVICTTTASAGPARAINVLNCTIVSNFLYSSTADDGNYGGGNREAIAAIPGFVINTIAWGNSPAHVPTGWSPYPAYEAYGALVAYGIFDGSTITNGTGVTNTDPLFVNPSVGGFSLAPNSPARSAGDPSSPANPDGSRSDIGWRADRFFSFIAGPSIASQPQSATAAAHGTVTFSVSATGAAPLNYQWSLDGTNLSGATASSITVSNVTQSALGTYVVVVTNSFGATVSSDAVLSMFPFLANPFLGLDTYWGFTNTLSVQAWGTGPLSYQWFDNGIAIANATNQTLTLTSIQFTNAGLYSVVVSGPLGSVTNTPEQVVVNPAGVSLGMYPGVSVSGTVGYTYSIQSAPDLSNTNGWSTVATLTLIQPVELWVDINVNASSPTNQHRFYRVLPGQ